MEIASFYEEWKAECREEDEKGMFEWIFEVRDGKGLRGC